MWEPVGIGNMAATKGEVVAILERIKRALGEYGLQVAFRGKNNSTLLALGLTKQNQEDIIFGLRPKNYVKGPEPDRDRPGELWVFGAKASGRWLYLKLKLIGPEGMEKVKCVSFHTAERSLDFPFVE